MSGRYADGAGGSDDPSAGGVGDEGERLRAFWRSMQTEVEQVSGDLAEFKNHQLPLARIKKIMKSDEDVRMISAEAPVLFAKACELFILEISLKAWMHAESCKRRTLQRSDFAAVINNTYILDFLQDVIPREGEEGGPRAGAGAGGDDEGGAPEEQGGPSGGDAGMGGPPGAAPMFFPYPQGMPMLQPMDPAAMALMQQQAAMMGGAQGAPQQWAPMPGGAATPQLPEGDASSQL